MTLPLLHERAHPAGVSLTLLGGALALLALLAPSEEQEAPQSLLLVLVLVQSRAML